MSVNTYKERLAALKNKGQRTNPNADAFLKLEEGKTVIRMVPYLHSKDGTPFVNMPTYYNFGKRSYISPKALDPSAPDPVIAYADRLLNRLVGESYDKDMYKFAKRLAPSDRYFAPVIVVGKETEGIKYWSIGVKIYEALLELFASDDWGDITDPVEGHTLTLEYTPKDKSDTGYAKTSFTPSPKANKLSPEVVKMINDPKHMPPVESLFEIATSEELEAAFSAYLSAQGTAPTASEEPTKELKGVSAEAESQLDELFGK